MNLPTPKPDQVREFATIYQEEFGVVLSGQQAWEAATLTLQLFYLGTYGLKTKAPDVDEMPLQPPPLNPPNPH